MSLCGCVPSLSRPSFAVEVVAKGSADRIYKWWLCGCVALWLAGRLALCGCVAVPLCRCIAVMLCLCSLFFVSAAYELLLVDISSLLIAISCYLSVLVIYSWGFVFCSVAIRCD